MKDIRSVPSTEATTAVQIQNLLNIAGTMASVLLVPNQHISEPHHERVDLDGGAKSACEMVLIETCNTLTDIIRDKTRWNLTLQRALEVQALKINQNHIEVLEMQKKAVAGLATPSYKHKPSLVRLNDGYYCAYLGDNPEDTLCGIGRTAEEAFAAFDEVFFGRVPESMISYLLAQEQKLKQQHEKTQDAEIVDGTGTKESPRAKSRRRKPRGNS